MTILEKFALIFFGFLLFLVVFIRFGFLLGSPIGSLTLVFALLIYCTGLSSAFSLLIKKTQEKVSSFLALGLFLGTLALLIPVTLLLSNTFDTSWDGQGYHQTAIIALSNSWNPIWEPAIQFKQELPSQIFAEGYPSALWEIQATIYSLTGKINSAKVTNIAIAIIAAAFVFALLRRISIGKIPSLFFMLLITIQPVYLIQLLTFMQDGFGYELLVLSAATLAIYIVQPKAQWAAAAFLLAELLLASSKYSNLPVTAVLFVIFIPVFLNRLMNRDFRFKKQTVSFIVVYVFLALVFAYLPYGRNLIAHKAMFYPTDDPQLMGAVKYNNIPLNIKDENKLTLLFYGIFSRSQTAQSGDPTNPSNVANLKIPYTFSPDEVTDGAALYNNRVGGAGPLFSGIVLTVLAFIIFASKKASGAKERYAGYAAVFGSFVILVLALLAPTPNLLRYVNQLQLLPFAMLVPIYAVYKKKYVKIVTGVLLMLMAVNIGMYTTSVTLRNVKETGLVNAEFKSMRNSGKQYGVRAQQFYSSYIVLKEQNVKFRIADSLKCEKMNSMVASSTTTHYCEMEN